MSNKFSIYSTFRVPCLIVLLFLFPAGQLSASSTLNIHIVYSKNFDQSNQILARDLSKYYKKSRNIRVTHGPIGSKFSMLRNNKSSYLFITTGYSATLETLKAKPLHPVVAVLIPKIGFDQIVNSTHSLPLIRKGKLSAIYLDQPIDRQAKLASLLFPQARNVGILFGQRSFDSTNKQYFKRNNIGYYSILKNRIKAFNLNTNTLVVKSEKSLSSLLNKFVSKNDVLLSVIDPVVSNRRNMKTILVATYRNRVPLIGISRSYLQAGAAAAVYTTPNLIAKELIEKINKLRKYNLPAPNYPKYFNTEINNQAARSFKLKPISPRILNQKMRGR